MSNGVRVDSKKAVLAVLDILKRYSNENQRMSITAIQSQMLLPPYNTSVNRDTIKDTLIKLQEFYGEETIKCEGTDRKGTKDREENVYTYSYYYNQTLSNKDIQLLINSVMFSKILPKDKVQSLTRTLKSFATDDFQKKLNYLDFIPEKHYTLNQLTQDNMAMIYDVIYQNRKTGYDQEKRISFYFNGYGKDKQLHKLSEARYEVRPLRLCEYNTRNYLICYKENTEQLSHYRIDLMTDLCIEHRKNLASNDRKKELIKQLSSKAVSDYMSEHLYMFYGEAQTIEISIQTPRGDASLTFLYDAFGSNWEVIDYKSDADQVTVRVRCTIEAMKIWVMQYINRVKVVGPEGLKDKINQGIVEALKAYSELIDS